MDSGDIHEIGSLVIIFKLSLVFHGGLLQSWDRWREARVSISISHLRSIMTSLAINSCFTAVLQSFQWLIMLNYDMPHVDEFDFDGQITVFPFWLF